MIEEWISALEENLDWREAELASFKILLSSTPKESVRQTALLRAAWALLYAHYEGFCKFAWDIYLDALEKCRLPRSEFVECIACFSLESDFRRFRGNLSPDAIWDFCTSEFGSLLSLPAVFEQKLETNSNLWPNLFKENARKVGLPTHAVDEHLTRLKALVARRNDIAHGKKMIVKNIHEYAEYENAALLVMHELAINIIESLEQEKYRRVC